MMSAKHNASDYAAFVNVVITDEKTTLKNDLHAFTKRMNVHEITTVIAWTD